MERIRLGKGKHDWIAGANSAIQKKVLVPSMDWKKYHIKHEVQFLSINKPYDTEFCVSFSANKILGTLFMYYLRNNLIPPADVQWFLGKGYFQNGFVNFNERFTAINGKTTSWGAYQYKVAEGLRNNGVIPQAMFPYADNFKDNIDPKFITKEMIDLGQESLEHFSINYEWVSNTDYLKYGPLQAVVCYKRSNDPLEILAPTRATNHAVEVVSKTKDYAEIDDTYYQVYKRYRPDKVFSLLLYHLTFKSMSTFNEEKFLKENDLKWVRNTENGAFGRIMQDLLFTFATEDRGTLALLDDKVRKNGIQIDDKTWKVLPKREF